MTALCATSQIINLHANSSLSNTWQFHAGAQECQKSWWGQTYVVGKVIYPKYYKHLKKGAQQSIWADKKWVGSWQKLKQ